MEPDVSITKMTSSAATCASLSSVRGEIIARK